MRNKFTFSDRHIRRYGPRIDFDCERERKKRAEKLPERAINAKRISEIN
jgi:hypothetical protein